MFMTESTLQHEGSPYEGITISSEDSDFDDLQDGEEIRDDEVILGSSQGTMYRSGGRLIPGHLGPLSLNSEKTMRLEPENIEPERRARVGTGGSQGTHSRGHSRNLSTSSIAYPTSTSSQPPELRRRPPQLIAANDTSAATDDHAMDGATTPRAISNGEPAPSDGFSPAGQHPDTVTKSSRDDGPARALVSGHYRKTSTMSDDAMNVGFDGKRDGSDQETEPGGAPPSKKKKGQRSFQCHCSRRFSQLDNLRQHAQTVHVNEEIPGDSLAATGTRFQLQRKRPATGPPRYRKRVTCRARVDIGDSQGAHSRGYSRNSSTSSIAYPQLSMPPGLIFPGPSAGGPPYTPSNVSSGGLAASPQYASPMSSATHGFWEGNTAARRLSVPTSSNLSLAQDPGAYPPPHGSPAVPPYRNAAGVFASPTNTNYPASLDESTLSAAEAEMPRRTWYPSTYHVFGRPSTSGLSQYHTPDTVQGPPLIGGNSSAEQPPRLPGIESFDKVASQHRPLTPPTRKASPMQIDSQHRSPPPPSSHSFGPGYNYRLLPVRPAPPISGPGHRRCHWSWGLHHNLTGLDIRDRRASQDASQWSQQTIAEPQNVPSPPSSSYQPTFPPTVERSPEEHRGHVSNLTQTSPEDSGSSDGVHTPSTASVEYHPAIVHSSGYIESHDSSYTPSNVYPGRLKPENIEPEGPGRPRLDLDRSEKFQSRKREELYMASSDAKATLATPRSNEVPQFCEYKLGSARLGYGLKLVRHGLYDESPSSLIIFDFDFNYDNTCAITKADITIVLGSRVTEQSVKPKYGSIVPFATDMRWPSKASGPSSDTEISNETLWKLKLGAQGYSLETPENRQSVSGKKTDSSWRIAGGPVFVDKPFRCRRGFLWRVDGHEFNRFPIPEIFSLGMIVRHDMVDYWVKVKIDGSLRGRVRNSVANLRAWSSRRSTRWMIHPTESTAVLENDLVTEMQGRCRKIF